MCLNKRVLPYTILCQPPSSSFAQQGSVPCQMLTWLPASWGITAGLSVETMLTRSDSKGAVAARRRKCRGKKKADCCLLFSVPFSFYILIILFTYIWITYIYAFRYYFLSFLLLDYKNIYWYLFQESWMHRKPLVQLPKKAARERKLQHNAAIISIREHISHL